MLENCESARKDQSFDTTLNNWLHERQDMLVRYCALTDSKVLKGEKDGALCKSIRELCQLMMDYVSAGHFKVYDQLLQKGDQQVLAQASQLYAIVEQTTDTVLDFNDKYQEVDDLSSLARDLSQLGEDLATRFEAEDSMITLMQMKH